MTQMRKAEDQLRRMILDMEIGPGDRPTERWIEERLGASRSSVRTALFRLEAEGLVSREGRGWIVPPIDVTEIEQLFIYREVLEAASIRLGGHAVTDDWLAEIEALLDTLHADATKEQADEAGRDFHIHIARLSGNEVIIRGVADAMTRLSRARWLENHPLHHGWDEHRAILDALRRRDTDQAVTLLEAHIRGSRARLVAALQASRRTLRARGITLRSSS